MSYFGELVTTIFERRYRRAGKNETDTRSSAELCSALLGSQGEVSGAIIARNILDRYSLMNVDEKLAFFEFLASDLEIVPDDVSKALEAYKNSPSKKTYQNFQVACEPKRQELARRLNQVPGATGQLVKMRRDLLGLMKQHSKLEPLDLDFRHLFASWFNRGFLVLRPINWDSPAEILDKIIAYEAVHAIDSWDALRARLKPADRRCFGFFHPAMADEPLIFVEVALTRGIPNSIQSLLADERNIIQDQEADTAVFYSISNCQAGLAGISFGNSLIKQVVADLSRVLPNLKTFVTLSPIPGLNRWVKEAGQGPIKQDAHGATAAHYLLEAKAADGLPFDPVARFHLGNGAIVHAVHVGADTSRNGLKQSNGTMVNYLYDISKIAENHEQFAGSKKIAASQKVQQLSADFAEKYKGSKA